MSAAPHVTAPEHIEAHHDASTFDCGQPELDDWLRLRALSNEASGASRTYVICAEGRVVGYYALATGAVARAAATGKARRQMPDPIPVMIIGRLAVDTGYQGRGLGHGLLRDALLRTLQVAKAGRNPRGAAARDDGRRQTVLPARRIPGVPLDPMTMMITIADVEKALATP